MKTIMQAALLAALLSLTSACASMFSAKTEAIYEITPDGKKISYKSDKEQQGLRLDLQEQDGNIKSVKIDVDKSTTAESAIAASLALQIELTKLLQQMLPLAAAAGGVPVK